MWTRPVPQAPAHTAAPGPLLRTHGPPRVAIPLRDPLLATPAREQGPPPRPLPTGPVILPPAPGVPLPGSDTARHPLPPALARTWALAAPSRRPGLAHTGSPHTSLSLTWTGRAVRGTRGPGSRPQVDAEGAGRAGRLRLPSPPPPRVAEWGGRALVLTDHCPRRRPLDLQSSKSPPARGIHPCSPLRPSRLQPQRGRRTLQGSGQGWVGPPSPGMPQCHGPVSSVTGVQRAISGRGEGDVNSTQSPGSAQPCRPQAPLCLPRATGTGP